eukprot:scaffold61572_cov18-Tisochrysis_lutea.AAC.3
MSCKCVFVCVRSGSSTAGSLGGRISRLILVDREVDLITPMLSQITFEGLIDEVTGIKSGGVPWTPKGMQAAACQSMCWIVIDVTCLGLAS